MIKNILISMRPTQWYKNVLLFVGVVFSGNILNFTALKSSAIGFVYFCMLSSGIYIFNDILDRDRDKNHPTKCVRPIACRQLKVAHAFIVAFLLISGSLAGAYLTVNLNFFIISVSYIILMLLYSLLLKYHLFVDVIVIASGLVIRAVAGCLAIGVFVSSWLIVCTFLLALFLALEKRWYGVTLAETNGTTHNHGMPEYSPRLLELLIGIITSATIVSYLLYTAFAMSDFMLITAPFVVYGLFRYLYLVHQKRLGGEPHILFRDIALIIDIGLWCLAVLSINIYEIR